ncbi:RNA methyltransferase [Agaricicola taiwanensis]|uniref:RNA methyltransferase n=1 Tax=Agaricicola taiwanensis TaxID=591372 RepID=A0A8J2YCH4_9RHOB|nr:RNA methyltransferase [Agaricicola taiwanensis]GGE30684.1 RNA methyltransferase [Agaricicola taiwanensis]
MTETSHAIRIEDRDDPRIAAYRDVRERDLIGRQGCFIAEGEVVLRVLLGGARFDLDSILIAANRLDGLQPLLASVPRHVPVYAAASPVMDAVVGFHIHRGILAVGRIGAPLMADDLLTSLPPRALVLALVGIANHDNMGGIFRNAAAFGVNAVFLDDTSCDPLYRKAVRVSVGGCLKIPFARIGSAEVLVDALAAHGVAAYALSPSGTTDLSDLVPAAQSALLLGAEGPGLPHEVLQRAHTVRISMADGFDSLNVATSSGIALHALRAKSFPLT